MRIDEIIVEASGGVTITGIHFSKKKGLTILKGASHGEGITGAEAKRKRDYPETYINDRVYFYNAPSLKKGDIRREPGLGVVVYKAELKNVYDASVDSRGIKKKAVATAKEQEGGSAPALAMNLMEQYIRDAGYSGYTMSGVTIMFGDVRNIDELGEVPPNFKGTEQPDLF